jgi:hypothetical protein
MGGLRNNRDCIGLTLAWAILVQVIVLGFTYGLHAATLAAGSDGAALCSVRAPGGEQIPAETPQHTDWQCCATACRLACSTTTAGLLPEAGRIPLPAFAVSTADLPRLDAPLPKSTDLYAARPRAPPRA